MNKKLIVITLMTLVFSACSLTQKVKSKGVTVPSGTVVPFAKVSNESFAENYIDADILVDCEYFSSQNKTSLTNKKIPKGHFAFQVIEENTNPSRNELTGQAEGMVVYAPLKYSDLVFGLKKGDKITLRGGTLVTKLTTGFLNGINTRYIHFVATEVSKK